VQNVDDSLPYQPSVDDVAQEWLRARTKDSDGVELGEFTADTRPTYEQALSVVRTAARDVYTAIGSTSRTALNESARDVAALLAAIADRVVVLPGAGRGAAQPVQRALRAAYKDRGRGRARPAKKDIGATASRRCRRTTRSDAGAESRTRAAAGDVDDYWVGDPMTLRPGWMGWVRIVFEISGDRQIERELLRIGDRAADASPAFDRIIDLWASETAQQFQSEGAHASGGWAPLAPSTLARKRTLFGGGRILHETGTLESSLTDRGDPNMIVQISRDEVAWGSRVGYEKFHQTGTSRMPRRRPVEFTEAARRETVRILQRWFITGELA
jgi:phage gpG-like protein